MDNNDVEIDKFLGYFYNSGNSLDLGLSTDEDLNNSPIPAEQNGPPLKGDNPGQYNFEVALDIEKTDRKKYVYSHLLNRVYLMMGVEMAVQFTWDWKTIKGVPLWVRATPIYSASEHQEMKVSRCLNHKEIKDSSNKDIPCHAIPHVMHSVRHDSSVQYCGSETDDKQWHSIAVLLPSEMPTGVRTHQHVYRFGCKHSCHGINRRKMEVLFTLETSDGEILGRKSLGVRVCSCPRRDLQKDEREYKFYNGYNMREEPPQKKRLIKHTQKNHHSEIDENVRNVMSFHNYQIPEGNSYHHIVNTAYNINVLLLQALPPGHPAAKSLEKTVFELKAIVNNSSG